MIISAMGLNGIYHFSVATENTGGHFVPLRIAQVTAQSFDLNPYEHGQNSLQNKAHWLNNSKYYKGKWCVISVLVITVFEIRQGRAQQWIEMLDHLRPDVGRCRASPEVLTGVKRHKHLSRAGFHLPNIDIQHFHSRVLYSASLNSIHSCCFFLWLVLWGGYSHHITSSIWLVDLNLDCELHT